MLDKFSIEMTSTVMPVQYSENDALAVMPDPNYSESDALSVMPDPKYPESDGLAVMPDPNYSVTSVPTYSVSAAIDKIGLGKFQYRVTGLCGLFWAADAMEITLLSVLEPVLVCVFGISSVQVASLTTAVFLGMTVGSAGFGTVGDWFGRKVAMVLGASFLAVYGLLSAAAPNFTYLLLLRCLVGAYMGSLPQAVTVNTEMTPGSYRAKTFVFVSCCWAAGSVTVVLLALAVLSFDTWRIFVALCAVPPIVFLVLQFFWIPESPHYLQSKGRTQDAKDIIQKVSRINKVDLGEWILDNREEQVTDSLPDSDQNFKDKKQNIFNGVSPNIKSDTKDSVSSKKEETNNILPNIKNNYNDTEANNTERGNLFQLLSQDWRRTTLILWFLLFYSSFGYYGVVLLSPGIISQELCSSSSFLDNKTKCSIRNCHQLSTTEFLQLLWTTSAEVPGILLSLFLSDRFGRKWILVFGYLIIAGATLASSFCFLGHILQVMILFVGRGVSVGIFCLVTLYTSEVYPSPLRASGIGFGYVWARFGGMLTPYVAQVLAKTSVTISQSVYCVVGLLAAAAASRLQVETMGKSLQ